MAPIRRIKKGYRSITGHFKSLKNNRQIAFESTLERNFFLALEFDNNIVRYEEQPFVINYTCEGKARRYTPDAFVHFADYNTLYEVKYQREIDKDPNLQIKLECIDKYIKDHQDYSFQIFTEFTLSPTFTKNIKFLYKFAFLKSNVDVIANISDTLQASKCITVRSLLHSIEPISERQSMLVPYIWHFIVLNPKVLDLNKNLTMSSELKWGK